MVIAMYVSACADDCVLAAYTVVGFFIARLSFSFGVFLVFAGLPSNYRVVLV